VGTIKLSDLGYMYKNIKLLIEKYCTWSMLRHFGSNRLVRSANIWAIVVPVIAKFFDKVEEIVTIELFNKKFELHLSLPFSWKVFFFMAIIFLIANIIYSLFCPRLIKETASYSDFLEQKRSQNELSSYYKDIENKGLTMNLNDNIKHMFHRLAQDTETVAYTGIQNRLSFEELEVITKEAYAILVDALALANSGARLYATILYFIGLVLFGYIAIQNIFYVVVH
jgi:hypothetical protein